MLDLLRKVGLLPESPSHLTLDEDELLRPHVELWATSPERAWYINRRKRLYIWIGLGIVLLVVAVWLVTWHVHPTRRTWWWAGTVATAAVVLLGWCTTPYWAARRAFRERVRGLAAYRVDVALDDICADPQLPLSGLFELNRRQLDEYQEITKRQQRLAFRLTWAAMLAAFLLIAAGIVLSFAASAPSQRFVAGGLSGLAAALSTYLGRTFFKANRAAMDQLNRYYVEPFTTGRLLAAERAVARLSEDPVTRPYVGDVIKALLAHLPSIDVAAPDDETAGAEAPQDAAATAGKKAAPRKTTPRKRATNRTATKATGAAAPPRVQQRMAERTERVADRTQRRREEVAARAAKRKSA